MVLSEGCRGEFNYLPFLASRGCLHSLAMAPHHLTSASIVTFLFCLSHFCLLLKKTMSRASLVAQWLRIHLPMQGTQVRALVQEDPTCRGASKPMLHNYSASALEPASHNYGSPHT